MIAIERARRELAEAEAEVIEAKRRLGTAEARRDRKLAAFNEADDARRAADYFSQVWAANEAGEGTQTAACQA